MGEGVKGGGRRKGGEKGGGRKGGSRWNETWVVGKEGRGRGVKADRHSVEGGGKGKGGGGGKEDGC